MSEASSSLNDELPLSDHQLIVNYASPHRATFHIPWPTFELAVALFCAVYPAITIAFFVLLDRLAFDSTTSLILVVATAGVAFISIFIAPFFGIAAIVQSTKRGPRIAAISCLIVHVGWFVLLVIAMRGGL